MLGLLLWVFSFCWLWCDGVVHRAGWLHWGQWYFNNAEELDGVPGHLGAFWLLLLWLALPRRPNTQTRIYSEIFLWDCDVKLMMGKPQPFGSSSGRQEQPTAHGQPGLRFGERGVLLLFLWAQKINHGTHHPCSCFIWIQQLFLEFRDQECCVQDWYWKGFAFVSVLTDHLLPCRYTSPIFFDPNFWASGTAELQDLPFLLKQYQTKHSWLNFSCQEFHMASDPNVIPKSVGRI